MSQAACAEAYIGARMSDRGEKDVIPYRAESPARNLLSGSRQLSCSRFPKRSSCGNHLEILWEAELVDFGFRAMISSSFADIFANNSSKNGFLAVQLSEDEAAELMRRAREVNDYQLTVDLEQCEVRDDQGFRAKFPIDEFVRHCLLDGLDDIGLTLQHEGEIAAYEAMHPVPSAFEKRP